MKRRLRLPAATLIIIFGICGSSYGQIEDFYFSHWNMGLDARSTAMGKTGIALLSDSFASALNPAGLTGLKTIEFGLAGSYNHLIQNVGEYGYESRPFGFYSYLDYSRITRKSFGFSPEFAALTIPLNIGGRPLVIQASFQRRVPFSMTTESETGFSYRTRYNMLYTEKIRTEGTNGFGRLSVSVAFAPVKALSLGLTFSRWSGSVSLPSVRTLSYATENFYGLDAEWDENHGFNQEFSISGSSLDAGVIINLGDRFHMGFLYRLGWNADLEYASTATYSSELSGESLEGSVSGTAAVGMPAGFGAGLAFRIIDELMLTIDYNRTFWGKSRITNFSTADASGYAPEPRAFYYPALISESTEKQTDSHHFGLGLEYLHGTTIGDFFFRQGFFLESQHLFEDFGRQKSYWGLTMGPGFRMSHFCFNLAAALTFGNHAYARDMVSNAPQGEREEKTTLLILRTSLTFRF